VKRDDESKEKLVFKAVIKKNTAIILDTSLYYLSSVTYDWQNKSIVGNIDSIKTIRPDLLERRTIYKHYQSKKGKQVSHNTVYFFTDSVERTGKGRIVVPLRNIKAEVDWKLDTGSTIFLVLISICVVFLVALIVAFLALIRGD